MLKQCSEIFEHVQKCSKKMFKNIQKCSKMFKNVKKIFKNVQNCFENVQNGNLKLIPRGGKTVIAITELILKQIQTVR